MVIEVLQVAERLADELLFPAAPATDAARIVPREQLDALAAAGLYGLAGPRGAGGLGADAGIASRVVEVLAGGCLATTFVWMQHHGCVRAVAQAPAGVQDRWLVPLCRGEVRAGIAIGGIRPGSPPLLARATPSGYRLTGSVPWVTGWGRVDVVHTASLDEAGDVLWLIVDAQETASLQASRLRLVAADASSTVTLTFDGHPVPSERVTHRQAYRSWQAGDAAGLRGNGALALGVAGRCGRLLDPDGGGGSSSGGGGGSGTRGAGGALAEQVHADVDAVRRLLDAADPAADPDALPAARAAASELAWRAATLLVVAGGSRSVMVGGHAQRLAREAMLLLVFGSRPAIKTALLARLATA